MSQVQDSKIAYPLLNMLKKRNSSASALEWTQWPLGDVAVIHWQEAVRQQAITWTNVDQVLYIVSLGNNELNLICTNP